jgi:hypothetical protein
MQPVLNPTQPAGALRLPWEAGAEPSGPPPPLLCKFWAAGRCTRATGCRFRHAYADEDEQQGVAKRLARATAARDALRRADSAADPYAEGSKAPHAGRQVEFARWLVDTFGLEALGRGGGVLDVAGGRGALAFELQCKHGVRCTSLDDQPAAGKLNARQRKFLRKQANQVPPHPNGGRPFGQVRALLSPSFEATAAGQSLLSECSVLVGMHPDEATEAIVDAALKYGKPFAILPCCVFPKLFPHRRLLAPPQPQPQPEPEPELEPEPEPQPVLSYAHFIAYLRAKDGGDPQPSSPAAATVAGAGAGAAPECGGNSHIQSAHLAVEGRNQILYRLHGSAPQPSISLAWGGEAQPRNRRQCDDNVERGSLPAEPSRANG